MKVYIKNPWKEILIWGFVFPSVIYMFIEIYRHQIIIKLYNCLYVSFFSMGHLFQLSNLIRRSHRAEKQNLQVLESDLYVPRHRQNYDKR